MTKKTKETIGIGVGLIGLSLILHFIHFLIFRDLHHILIFLFADIAFIPMEVFFTTVVIDKLLENREKTHLLEKLNMLIGVFYTELGTKLLTEITKSDRNEINNISNGIIIDTWDDKSFKNIQTYLLEYDYKVDVTKLDLNNIRAKLDENKNLLVNLISNGNLLEHGTDRKSVV